MSASSPQPQRSVYRKLRTVLQTARRGKWMTTEQLIEALLSEGSTEFTRYKVSRGKVSLVPCSVLVIRRMVHVARDLDLLSEAGRLTVAGRRAVDDSAGFDGVVAAAVLERLRSLGVSRSALDERIRLGLTRPTIESLPTLDNVVMDLMKLGGSRRHLRLYLQLLAACGAVRTTRKKLFLPDV